MSDIQQETSSRVSPFYYEIKRARIASTQLYQRKIFIESMRQGHSLIEAMADAGIEDRYVAETIYKHNSRPVIIRRLVKPEDVR